MPNAAFVAMVKFHSALVLGQLVRANLLVTLHCTWCALTKLRNRQSDFVLLATTWSTLHQHSTPVFGFVGVVDIFCALHFNAYTQRIVLIKKGMSQLLLQFYITRKIQNFRTTSLNGSWQMIRGARFTSRSSFALIQIHVRTSVV